MQGSIYGVDKNVQVGVDSEKTRHRGLTRSSSARYMARSEALRVEPIWAGGAVVMAVVDD